MVVWREGGRKGGVSERERDRQTERHIRYETLFVSANLCRISWPTFGRRTRRGSARMDSLRNSVGVEHQKKGTFAEST